MQSSMFQHLTMEHILNTPALSFAIAGISVLIATLVYYVFIKSRDLPPGPMGLPFIGYWLFISNEKCSLQMENLKKKYGDVFSVTFCGRLHINLGSHKAIREAHLTKSDCFTGRITSFSMLGDMFEDGVAFSNGESWKVQRKIFLQLLREYGFSTIKGNMSGSLYDSINETIEYLKTTHGEPVNIIELLTNKCNNVLRSTLFGDNGITEEQVRKINEHYAVMGAAMLPCNLLLTGFLAKYVFYPMMPLCRASKRNQLEIEKILYKIIDDHKSTYNEDHMRNIIDEYLKERNERRKKGDPAARHLTDKALMSSLLQFVGDGVLSVAAVIGLFLQCIIEHPEEQEKIYKELIDVVGVDRQPTVEDKGKLPYTNAFLFEVLRTTGSDFFPFFPSLECTKETTLRGYRIPKGSMTLMNIFSTNYDPETYEEPTKFNPSRFIATDDKRRAELPVNFGVGKRACLGEGFTMMQIFLFLAAIVKNFQLSSGNVENDNKLTAFELLMSGKLRICATPRVKV